MPYYPTSLSRKSNFENTEFVITYLTSLDFKEKLNSLNSLIIIQLCNSYFSNSINLNFPIFQKIHVQKIVKKQLHNNTLKEGKNRIWINIFKVINVPISILRTKLNRGNKNTIALEKQLHHLNQLDIKIIIVTPFYSLNKLNNIVRKSSMKYFIKLAKYFENIELVDGYSGFNEKDFLDDYHMNEIGLTKLNERINNLIDKIQTRHQ